MQMDSSPRYAFERKRIWLALLPALLFVSLIGLCFLVQQAPFPAWPSSRLGILPGEVSGLKGILFSPFLHTSLSHLWSNMLSLLILLWLLFYFYRDIAYSTLPYLWLLSGLVTWIIGRDSYHVGASGLVFAILFFLFFSGILRRYVPLIAVSLIVAFIYGGTLWSMFPVTELVDSSISWEGHLSGAISGLVIALLLRRHGPQKPEVTWEEEEDEVLPDESDENGASIP